MKSRKDRYHYGLQSKPHKIHNKPYTVKPPQISALKPDPMFYHGNELPFTITLIDENKNRKYYQ